MRIIGWIRRNWFLSLLIVAAAVYALYRVATERVMTLWSFNATDGAVIWSSELEGDWKGIDRPVLSPGTALVVPQIEANKMHGIDPASGKVLWTRDFEWLPGRDHDRLYAEGDSIYAVQQTSDAEHVRAFDARSGADRWTAADRSASSGGIARADGLWLALDSVLERLDAVTGKPVTFNLPPGNQSNRLYCILYTCMATNNAAVLVANADGAASAVWPDGSRPPLALGDRVQSAVINDGVAIFAERYSLIAAYDLSTGRRIWETNLGGGSREFDFRRLSMSGDKVFVTFESNRGDLNESWLAMLDARTGGEFWRQAFSSDTFAASQVQPAVANDRVFIVGDELVQAFGTGDGARAWRFALDSGPDAVVVDAAANRAYAMGRTARWRRWLAPLGFGREI